MLQLEGADTQKIARFPDQGRTAPVRMPGRGEDRFLDQVLPVAGELLARHDIGRDGMPSASRAGQNDPFAVPGVARVAEGERRQVERFQGLDETETGRLVVAQYVSRDDAAAMRLQQHLLGFRHQVADGENDPILADHDPVAAPLDPERVRRIGVGGHARTQPDDRTQRAIEIEPIIHRPGLRPRRHFPIFMLVAHRIFLPICLRDLCTRPRICKT